MMRELTADLLISLDGFASGADQPAFFGYFGPELGNWISEHLNQPQVIIMRRLTYQALAGFSAPASDEPSQGMTRLRKLVFSRTLQEPLDWKNTLVISGSAEDEIRMFKQQPGDPLRSIGSIKLVKSADARWPRGASPAYDISAHSWQRWEETDF